jgi:hypothetical protein
MELILAIWMLGAIPCILSLRWFRRSLTADQQATWDAHPASRVITGLLIATTWPFIATWVIGACIGLGIRKLIR